MNLVILSVFLIIRSEVEKITTDENFIYKKARQNSLTGLQYYYI
jgi:hypothetical protein